MAEANSAMTEYITKEIFNVYIENLINRINDEEKLNDMRYKNIEAIIEKALTVMHADNQALEAGIDKKLSALDNKFEEKITALDNKFEQKFSALDNKMEEKITALDNKFEQKFTAMQGDTEKKFAEIQGQINVLSEKLEHTTDTLTVAIDGVNNRVDELEKRIEDVHHSQSMWFTVLGVLATVVPIAVAVVQIFIK